jgi:hypothetical protein
MGKPQRGGSRELRVQGAAILRDRGRLRAPEGSDQAGSGIERTRRGSVAAESFRDELEIDSLL